MRQLGRIGLFILALLSSGAGRLDAQTEIGFIEQFALAEDRREAVRELIPGTDDYFFYAVLNHQNEKQLPEADGLLQKWAASHPASSRLQAMKLRQALLNYETNPAFAMELVRKELGLRLNHQPPSRDVSAEYPSQIDDSKIDTIKLVDHALATAPGLQSLSREGLWQLVERDLSIEQSRSLLARLDRSDLDGTVSLVARELAARDTKGFGWAAIHRMLTTQQLDELARQVKGLWEQSVFVEEYLARQLPASGDLQDAEVLRAYLEALQVVVEKLPLSQLNVRALVMGNLLKLNLAEGVYDRQLFEDYLAIPRKSAYYIPLRQRNVRTADFGFSIRPAVPLAPLGNDEELVRRHLLHFLTNERSVDRYSKYIDRQYLSRALAESKILSGVGDPATWFATLPASEQQQLKQRVELQFAPDNQAVYETDAAVRLKVELKNVPELTIRVYQLSLKNYYRRESRPLGTDIDLDGMIPAIENSLEFDYAAERRHTEEIPLPQLTGRGAWVVDLLGAGIRSRALIRKGQLVASYRVGDAGQVFQVHDERGETVQDASLELQGIAYQADENGQIVIPLTKQAVTRNVLLVDGEFASRQTVIHHAEAYALSGTFLINRQSLVGGNSAEVLIATRLLAGDRPVSVELIESPTLEIIATDMDGTTSSQTVANVDLSDAVDFEHSFSVPFRLARLEFRLTGKVKRVSDGAYQSVSLAHSADCNGILKTNRIVDAYLQQREGGFELQIRGRNGEPIPSHRVRVACISSVLKQPITIEMATNVDGTIRLGKLRGIREIQVTGSDLQQSSFEIDSHRKPERRKLHVLTGKPFGLFSSQGDDTLEDVALWRIVGKEKPAENLTQRIEIQAGVIGCENLKEGSYVFENYRTGDRALIQVHAGNVADAMVADGQSISELAATEIAAIESVSVTDAALVVKVANASPGTRVHLVGTAFRSFQNPEPSIQWPTRSAFSLPLTRPRGQFLNSLRLDEEYDYILQRRSTEKYPGNLLTRPSLLIHPWDIAKSENVRRDAQAGDALEAAAAPNAAPMSAADGEARRGRSTATVTKSFEFLASPARTLFNLEVVDGSLTIPLDHLSQCSHVAIHLVTPDATDYAEATIPLRRVATRDMRLASAFDAAKSLSQVRQVRVLAAGEQLRFDRSASPRFQTYASLDGVFQFYSSILRDPRWERLRFVTHWSALDESTKLKRYSEFACHELNVFLYFRDREFFDTVVKPFVEQKMEKQFVDHFLLGDDLSAYLQLQELVKLNAAELSLLARRDPRAAGIVIDKVQRYVDANPMDVRQRRQYFDSGLMGTALDDAAQLGDSFAAEKSQNANMNFSAPAAMAGGRGGNVTRGRRSLGRAKSSESLFELERLSRKRVPQLYQVLPKTRRWVETQYHQVRIADQSARMINASEFWSEYLAQDAATFLPESIELPARNLSEALIALALIDLPEEGKSVEFSSDDAGVALTAQAATIVMLEAISETKAANDGETGQQVFVGQEVLPQGENPRPVDLSNCVINLPYLAKIVVSNPTNRKLQIDLLHQCPEGAIPLAGGRSTQSQIVDIAAFSTYQTECSFYFPKTGKFEHYGAQVSEKGVALAAAPAQVIDVKEVVREGDQKSWAYIADWGTTDEVVAFLADANLDKIELKKIAFRMADKSAFARITGALANRRHFERDLWAYSVRHGDKLRYAELLAMESELHQRLGPAIDAPVIKTSQPQRYEYEHVEFKPLVLARIHQLGGKRQILNADLAAQYGQLLKLLAYQRSPTSQQKLQLTYYLLLQNRISEAIDWFNMVDRSDVQTSLQYDYLKAYLAFYQRNYDVAKTTSEQYANYPVGQWRDAFQKVLSQLSARDAMLAGDALASSETQASDDGSRREARNELGANQAAALDIRSEDVRLLISAANLKSVSVHYYVMDVELLFSRRPFVGIKGQRLPAIAPNASVEVVMPQSGKAELTPPDALRNKNLIVEATGGGLSQTAILTPSSLKCTVAESYGQVRVRNRISDAPVEAAYVKVYAKLRDGSVRFYKDGYTDLRGYFDFATLSTNDLESVERFAILVLDEDLGAEIREAGKPGS